MFKKISVSILMMVLLLAMAVSTAFAATDDISAYQDSTGNVDITVPAVPNTEFMFAGSNVVANSVFDTTTLFAGNAITLDGEYNGDVFVAGNTVTVNGKINGNLYATGNMITINGEVTRDAFVACNELKISNTAIISRDLFIGTATAAINGTVGRNLRAGVGTLTLNGPINGFVEADTDQLTINSNAVITGPINNRSENQAIVATNANAPAVNWEKVTQEQQPAQEKQGASVGSILLTLITKLAFILVIWLLITFLTKEFNENTTIMAKKHILVSLGIGAGFLFLSPLAVILSFIIYAPFGIAMTCLLITGMILAMPVAVVVFSKLLTGYFNNKMKPLLSSFVSVLIIAAAAIILGFIPVLNFLVGLFLVVMGMGFIGYNILFTNRKLKEERLEAADMIMIEEFSDAEESSKEDKIQ